MLIVSPELDETLSANGYLYYIKYEAGWSGWSIRLERELTSTTKSVSDHGFKMVGSKYNILLTNRFLDFARNGTNILFNANFTWHNPLMLETDDFIVSACSSKNATTLNDYHFLYTPKDGVCK